MGVVSDAKEKATSEGREPKDVLREWMLFYNEQAKDLLITIIACIEDVDERGKPNKRGDLLALMYKELTLASERAIECATKLAPYKHPKLESVELHRTDEKKFVIVIPSKQLTKEDWLENAQIAAPSSVISPPLSIKEQMIEDVEEMGYDIDDVEDFRRSTIED